MGVNVGVSYSDSNWSFSAGVGVMYYGDYNGFGKNGLEIRKSILSAWDDGKAGVSLGTNFWSGDFKQQTGIFGLKHGDWGMMYENDGKPFSGINADGNDQYRTAALSLSYKDYSVGFNLFTGIRTKKDYDIEKNEMLGGKKGYPSSGQYGKYYKHDFVNEQGTPHRLGALTFGYKGYKIGTNSEWVRHAIQNVAIHGTFIAPQRMFQMQSESWNSYFQYKTPNKFTSW